MFDRFLWFRAPLAASAFFLSGCGGGGGGATAPLITPTTAPTLAPSSTTATGKLVDDPGGSPLGGVQIGLAPWVPGAAPVPEGTTAPDGTFSFSAPNGHYLLYIGSNLTADTARPTIHDNITLTGGVQSLKGPILPPLPLITLPAVETSGNYRLLSLSATDEVPCFTAFNALRVSNGVPATVEDEWLAENVRNYNLVRSNPAYTPGLSAPGNSFVGLTTSAIVSGGIDCPTSTVPDAFNGFIRAPYIGQNPLVLWFGGNFVKWNNPGYQSSGLIEFPQDPRAFTDPNTTPPVWP